MSEATSGILAYPRYRRAHAGYLLMLMEARRVN
jgi:hypothetical protein